MTPRQGKKFRTSDQVGDLALTQRHAAGIDVHAAVHFVAVPVADVRAGFVNPDAKLPAGVRKFGTTTADLEANAAGSAQGRRAGLPVDPAAAQLRPADGLVPAGR